MKFGTDVCHIGAVTFERSRSTFKVICFENDPPATGWQDIINIGPSAFVHWPEGYVNLSRSCHHTGCVIFATSTQWVWRRLRTESGKCFFVI